MTKAEKTQLELVRQGWKYDHRALVKGYNYAGTVDDMRSKDGFDYCRVYTSECHMRRTGRYFTTFQISWVFRKER